MKIKWVSRYVEMPISHTAFTTFLSGGWEHPGNFLDFHKPWNFIRRRKPWKRVNPKYLAVISRQLGHVLFLDGRPVLRKRKLKMIVSSEPYHEWQRRYAQYRSHRCPWRPWRLRYMQEMDAEGGWQR